MTISWFQSNSIGEDSSSGKQPPKLAISEAVKVLQHPKSSRHGLLLEKEQNRFSQLLLEHGERHLQDWAVIAYSSQAKEKDMNPTNASSPRKPAQTQWAQNPTATTSSSTPPRRQLHKKKSPRFDPEAFPSTHMAKIEGRLHLCSRSIVFEPTDPSRGIVRCPFRKMDGAPREYPPVLDSKLGGRFEAMCIEFRSHRHLVMKENNTIGPHSGVGVPVEFRFTFLHSSPAPFVELCQKLFQLWTSQQNSKSSSAHNELPELDELLQPMLDRPFDLSQLVDVRERPLTPTSLQASLLIPLQRKPGCVVVTTERVYFQPANGALTPTDMKAQHWLVRNIVATACRYNGLRDCALELYFRDASSVLFAFERKRDREQLLRFLPRQAWSFTDKEFLVAVIQAWMARQISNYEYLLALNAAAGRSFHDLSRYPVFPWVIQDYESSKLDFDKPETFRDLSKPVGALNPERLEYFKTRLEGMQDMDDSFLYGTHYSTPGYVLYFLVRSMPEQMLCLQNGKFDAPDRMFYSMNHCFNCVLSNHADVKELIPEFYNTTDYDFLINARGLQLGATQTGERVDDVILPPWAKSPRDFLKKNRKALESEHVNKMLPNWIDLIFGYKSRGEAAKEADNLFHSCCYLGDNDLAAMKTEQERFQAELQATEFGLVPDQLFTAAHPAKLEDSTSPESVVIDDGLISSEFSAARSLASSRDADGKGEAWELLDPPSIANSSHGEQSLSNPASSSSALQKQDTDVPPPRGANSMDFSTVPVKDADSSPMAAVSKSPFTPIIKPSDSGGAEIVLSGSASPKSNRNRDVPLKGTGDMHGGFGSGAFSTLGSTNNHGRLQDAQSYDSIDSVSPRQRHPANSIVTPTDWDMKIIERRQVHSDAVSGCALILEGEDKVQLLATTSLDGGLMAHQVSLDSQNADDQNRRGFTGTLSRFSYIAMSRGQVTPSTESSKLTEYRRHTARDPLACLVLADDGAGGHVAFAGGHDDVVLAYGINSACAVASVYSHRDAVTGLDLISRASVVGDGALWLENSTHIMVSGSWDATVKIWSVTVAKGETVSVNREPLAELFDADSSVVCVSAISVQEFEPNGGLVIGAGCADGSFCVWNLHSDGVKTVIHNEPARRGSGPCSVLKWSMEAGRIHLFTGFSTGRVASFSLEAGNLRKESAVSFGVAVNCLVYSGGVLLVGCADGGLRLIPVRDGRHFDSKPSLWNGVNSKDSPGISSINITYIIGSDGTEKCICCSGGEDGSVALFELKKVIRSSLM